MSVYNIHNLTRFFFVPVNGPVILYEYFNCEKLSGHLNLIDGGERSGTFPKL